MGLIERGGDSPHSNKDDSDFGILGSLPDGVEMPAEVKDVMKGLSTKIGKLVELYDAAADNPEDAKSIEAYMSYMTEILLDSPGDVVSIISAGIGALSKLNKYKNGGK